MPPCTRQAYARLTATPPPALKGAGKSAQPTFAPQRIRPHSLSRVARQPFTHESLSAILPLDSFPTLRGARGQAPCTPKIAPFRLPSSVTLFCGRSSHKIVLLKRTSFRSPYTPNAVYLQGFCRFLRCPQTHTQGNNLAWCSWSFRGVLLVTDEAHAVPAPSVGNCPLSFSRSDRCNNA